MLVVKGRRLLRRLRRHERPLVFIFLLLLALDCLRIVTSRPRAVRAEVPPTRDSNMTVFIVSVHRNTEDILRSAWNDAIVALVDHLGPHNAHVVALESGSQDDTKEALKELKQKLDRMGATNTVELGMTVQEQLDELGTRPDPAAARVPGWIWDQQQKEYALRRIPYLANVRNEAMEPLRAMAKEGRKFDKVLWVNDVVFDTSDFLTLAQTRGGAYAAACSMDFKVYPLYYDTFALRDDRGDKTISYYWPWFRSPSARAAAVRGDPVRVKSCWNGMVIFDAAPFYGEDPLEFRGIDDSLADLHLEGSECCLIHADNPLSNDAERGVWLNPNVRVGYDVAVYRQIQGRFPGAWASIRGTWVNRWLGYKSIIQFALEQRTIYQRLAKWAAATPQGEQPRRESGVECLINEKQIMWQNGWKHL